MLHDSSDAKYTIKKINYEDYGSYQITVKCVPHNEVRNGTENAVAVNIMGNYFNFFISWLVESNAKRRKHKDARKQDRGVGSEEKGKENEISSKAISHFE